MEARLDLGTGGFSWNSVMRSFSSATIRPKREASFQSTSCLLYTSQIVVDDEDMLALMHEIFAHGTAGVGCDILPVSYTHLDVYKRQVLPSSLTVSRPFWLVSMPVVVLTRLLSEPWLTDTITPVWG